MILQHAANVHRPSKMVYLRLALTAAATFAVVCLSLYLLPGTSPSSGEVAVGKAPRPSVPAPQVVKVAPQAVAQTAETAGEELDALFEAFYQDEPELALLETEQLMDELNYGDAELLEDLL
ncbi:hypothetical protein BVY04_05100 [bacterium M21]|nr:hypothetical protein BVY04_05100 [bacterium M21]